MINRLYLLAILALFGCATQDAKKDEIIWPQKFAAVSINGPIVLKLNAQAGSREETLYKSHSVSENFDGAEKRLSEEESTKFTARAETVQSDEHKIVQVITVHDKEGSLDLHSMAMPEVGERLELGLRREGEVLSASGYPRQTIFYVPQISLPDNPVSVGDTWPMQSDWISIDGKFQFNMDMISILKGYYECTLPGASPDQAPLKDQCADIELSGRVTVGPDTMPTVAFKNDWKGRLLFAINAGTVVWSQVKSEEEYSADKNSRKVKTTLETQLMSMAPAAPVPGPFSTPAEKPSPAPVAKPSPTPAATPVAKPLPSPTPVATPAVKAQPSPVAATPVPAPPPKASPVAAPSSSAQAKPSPSPAK